MLGQFSKPFGANFEAFWEHFRTIWVAFWGVGAIPAKISEKCAKKVPLGAHLGAKMGQVGAKMALSCPTWRQDGTKMAILGRKMANLSPFWEPSWIIFAILGASFAILGAKSEIAKNLEKPMVF